MPFPGHTQYNPDNWRLPGDKIGEFIGAPIIGTLRLNALISMDLLKILLTSGFISATPIIGSLILGIAN